MVFVIISFFVFVVSVSWLAWNNPSAILFLVVPLLAILVWMLLEKDSTK